jgi:hypothetical protein
MSISNMKKINELFDARVDIVMDNYSSVFTKDDVISLLVALRTDALNAVAEAKPTIGITEEQFQEFNANVRYALERVLNDNNDIIDYSSVEFEIDYDNRIGINNIDINVDSITEELDEIMLDRFQEAFGELIISNEQKI